MPHISAEFALQK